MPPNPITPYTTTAALLTAMQHLRSDVFAEGRDLFERWHKRIQRRSFLPGALNLAYYLALRRRDLRPLQKGMRPYGLSSLGRSESRVMPNLDAVTATLHGLTHPDQPPLPRPKLTAFYRGERLLRRHSDQLFGRLPPGSARRTHIMVTFPSEAAHDAGLVHELVQRGMDVARLNCAHDTPDDWAAMIRHVRAAESALGRTVRIHMDLGGPKARTGPVIAPKKTALVPGDALLLTRDEPTPDERYPFQAQCALPEVFSQLRVGQRVGLDDGELTAAIETISVDYAVLRVQRVPDGGYKLKPEKGLNFPDTDLQLDPLTPDDLAALDFIAHHADTIGYSFVQEAADIEHLQAELRARTARANQIGLIAKIETPRAVRNLPKLIIAAGGQQPVGVMIARGDLAVELGFERMVEIQEEILWLCEAAYVPVIWATQVLEKFVKKGTPSRSEMTDAAMAVRAECVMLNKGPYVTEAVSLLDDVLSRMGSHQRKKSPQLRPLKAWATLLDQ